MQFIIARPPGIQLWDLVLLLITLDILRLYSTSVEGL